MDNKIKSCLIASTPHPQSRRILRNDFENDTDVPSPIGPVSSLASVRANRPKSNLTLYPDQKNLLKNRKRNSEDKVSDPARSTALKRLRGIAPAPTVLRSNTLSHSRNTHNVYPELIVLDSDEEEKFLKSITIHRNTPQNKVTKTAPETAVLKNRDKKTASKQIKRRAVLDSDEEEKYPNSVPKPRPEKKLTKTNTAALKKPDTRIKVIENKGKSIQSEESGTKLLRPASTSCLQQKKEAVPSKTKESTSKFPSQKPLGNLENIQLPVKRTKLVKNSSTKPSKVKEVSSKDIDLSEETSLFPDESVVFSKSTKIGNHNLTPIVQDLIDKNTIKWTPRASKGVKKKSVSDSSDEESDDKNIKNKDSKNSPTDNVTNNHNQDKPLVPTRSSQDLPSEGTSHGCTRKQPIKNSFPAECVSRFEDLVFKPSPHSGGIVAKSLQTQKLTFGYVEVKGGETFSGLRPHVTFIVLEGQVKAKVQGATQTLMPGDTIHIEAVSDSKYHFKNVGSDHSRLLFVKEKFCL